MKCVLVMLMTDCKFQKEVYNDQELGRRGCWALKKGYEEMLLLCNGVEG